MMLLEYMWMERLKAVQKNFLNPFTSHGFYNGLYVPLVFLILSNIVSITYIKDFQYIVNYCSSLQLNSQPINFFVDFEVTIHTSVIYIWLEAMIKGCSFYLAQNCQRKIKQLGLSMAYKSSLVSIMIKVIIISVFCDYCFKIK